MSGAQVRSERHGRIVPGAEHWSAAPLLAGLAARGSSFGDWQAQRPVAAAGVR